jgi:hypothetical protein
MAKRTFRSNHRMMLEHIAETWERICAAMESLH